MRFGLGPAINIIGFLLIYRASTVRDKYAVIRKREKRQGAAVTTPFVQSEFSLCQAILFSAHRSQRLVRHPTSHQ